MKEEIKIGDYVRNIKSGKVGYVADISPDKKKLTVLTLMQTYALWKASNVKLIKDAKK